MQPDTFLRTRGHFHGRQRWTHVNHLKLLRRRNVVAGETSQATQTEMAQADLLRNLVGLKL